MAAIPFPLPFRSRTERALFVVVVSLGHAAVGRNRSNADNMIKSNALKRYSRENRFPLFRIAL
ncbi:hypothetical protein B1812_15620 [Methylocystis bryophila]|uniref:Uncharacterized protein n=1 Tax=Methylocystis bryophila TaxID=655015 RepID=A0A1W6MXL1_9HYPH|nr:hypothetical protein B1812_15620 [Methylocystis bryophila]